VQITDDIVSRTARLKTSCVKGGTHSDILVKTPDEIRQGLEQGNAFIREIITQGRVLYERSG